MHRRDFLNLRRLSGVVVDGSDESSAVAGDLMQFSRRAMAADFEIILPIGLEHSLEAADDALDMVDAVEDQLTIYREESEVSRLNRNAPHRAVAVADNLFALLSQAEQLGRETGGAFDVASGTLSKVWGFTRREGRVPSEEEIADALHTSGMKHIVLTPDDKTVRFLRDGVQINLGSIGKGWALDCVASVLLDDWQLPSALMHCGRSSLFAFGSSPGRRDGWPVGVSHPWRTEERLAVVQLKNRGMATSAATFQHLEYNGKKLGHVIDPRTGWPAEQLASATALAPTAALADALATAFFILGADGTRAYCEAHPDVGAILLPPGDDARPIVCNLSADEVSIPGMQ